FQFTNKYKQDEVVTVSLGTGRFTQKKQPTWIWPWLQWVIGQMLESPGEQQTELTKRHYNRMTFYRIDTVLPEDIALDDVKRIHKLKEYGERLAEKIDWNAILARADTQFRIDENKTSFSQYALSP